MEEQKGVKIKLDDVLEVLSEKLKQAELNSAYMIAQLKAMQKENERLLVVIEEVKKMDAE